jgi:hypothetical protein
VSWPSALKVAVTERVTVRIAANDYEDLLAGIRGPSRRTKTERFKGYARIDAMLTPDADLGVVPEHSSQQVVYKGKPHKEWSWLVIPKTTGPHVLTLLVRGVNRGEYDDYDPDSMEYEVAFNSWYWLQNNLQQNGTLWLVSGLSLILSALSLLLQFLQHRRQQKTTASPNSVDGAQLQTGSATKAGGGTE